MQIKFCYKMAKNDGLKTFHANTVQENERILHESCYKNQVEIKSKEEYEKLFMKLNYICQIKSTKEEVQLNSSWYNKNVTNYTYGPISGFPSGSWWGIRMDCSRDRVHDPFDENVQNGPFGVTSICTLSVNLNEDIDFGNSLTFTGQKYVDGKLDKDPLIKNYENQIPVRLIRSYNLLNEFAPKTGYRYDGLYIVTNFWIGINSDSTKYYKFALLRLSNQELPLWSIKQSFLNTSKSSSVPQSTSTFLRICSENSSPNMYEFRKYSHSSEPVLQKGKYKKSNGFSQSSNFENKKIDEREKGTAESAIVTRHVFKKVNNNTECTLNIPTISTTSENKSLTHIGNRGSKTHNTNISIRTGLYNSSHSTQHDVKKSTLSPFCRSSKSLNILKTNQHMENWTASNKDKGRSLDGKALTIASNEFPKRINYTSFNAVKSELANIKFTKDTDTEVNSSKNGMTSNSFFRSEFDSASKEITNDSKDTYKTNVNFSDTCTNTSNLTSSVHRSEISTHKIVPKEAQELQSLESLDSLTPDKILHLINKRSHPLSKLLIGNMIGLSSEQSIAFKTQNLLTAQSEIKNKVATRKNNMGETMKKKNFEAISDDLIGSRYYKFRRRRKLSRKIMNKSEIKKHNNKLHNEKLQKDSVQSLDVLGKSLTPLSTYNNSPKNIPEENILYLNQCNTNLKNKAIKQSNLQQKKRNHLQRSTKSIKNDVGNKNETRMHLRAMKTIKSSIKKHINKKQRREITNLLIDAKIGPKIRGPRNRRLRCINNAYTKQSYENIGTAICALNKCQVSSEQSAFKSRNKVTKISGYKCVKNKQIGNVKRSETLNLKQNKIQKNLTVSKRSEKILSSKNNNNINNNDNINIKSKNNRKSKFLKANIKTAEDNNVTIVKGRKKKLRETDCIDSKCEVEMEFHNSSEKEISKPCKMDAITQCSLIKEPLTKNLKSNNFIQNNVRNEQYTFIKIEYGDLKDMKAEVCEAIKLDDENKDYTASQSNKKHISYKETVCNIQNFKDANTSLSSNILSTKEQNKSSPERTSAFVPVNILDNDLKIARLRSIGFKPITCNNSNEDTNNSNKGNCSTIFNSKVLKQNVDEKYNKYTNEENDVVVYMDDDLQYQDIENEDKNSLSIRRKVSNSKIYAVKDEQLSKVILEKESYNNLLLEQDLELPWHGWKKIVTSNDTYWVGW